MKQISFSTPCAVPVLRLAICGLLIASANQSVDARESNSSNQSGAIFATSASDGGRLIITRSPVLGYKSRVDLTIDGKPAGILARGRTYDRYITPGRHVLTASPSRGGDWRAVLDVRAGETYSYSASYNVNKLVLTPLTKSR
jgi:hypothetical protein